MQTMSSLSFGEVDKGTTSETDKLSAVAHGGVVTSVRVEYNQNTRYSNKNTGNMVTLNYTNNGGTVDFWLTIDPNANTDRKNDGNLYEGYAYMTIGGQEYVMPWGVRVIGTAPVEGNVIVKVPNDVWSDGSGYQMWIQATGGNLVADAVAALGESVMGAPWAAFRATLPTRTNYRIPVGCLATPDGSSVLPFTQVGITVPPGVYDFIFLNPDGTACWMAVGGYARTTGFEIKEGVTYTFIPKLVGSNDWIDCETDEPPVYPPTKPGEAAVIVKDASGLSLNIAIGFDETLSLEPPTISIVDHCQYWVPKTFNGTLGSLAPGYAERWDMPLGGNSSKPFDWVFYGYNGSIGFNGWITYGKSQQLEEGYLYIFTTDGTGVTVEKIWVGIETVAPGVATVSYYTRRTGTSYGAMAFDSTGTAINKWVNLGTINLIDDFDNWVPEDYPDSTNIYRAGINYNMPAGTYDYFVAQWLSGTTPPTILKYDSITIEAGKHYYFTTSLTGVVSYYEEDIPIAPELYEPGQCGVILNEVIGAGYSLSHALALDPTCSFEVGTSIPGPVLQASTWVPKTYAWTNNTNLTGLGRGKAARYDVAAGDYTWAYFFNQSTTTTVGWLNCYTSTAPIDIEFEEGWEYTFTLISTTEMTISKRWVGVRQIPVEGPVKITFAYGADIWGDNSGYQMWFDKDGALYDAMIAATTGGTWPSFWPTIPSYADYRMPVDAVAALISPSVRPNNSDTIVIPSGSYDFLVTNPVPGDNFWLAVGGYGRTKAFDFEAYTQYTFYPGIVGTNDWIYMTSAPWDGENTKLDNITLNISAPVAKRVPQAAVTGVGFGGTIAWAPADNPFAYDTAYTALVTLNALAGYEFTSGMAVNVPGALSWSIVSVAAGTAVVEVLYNKTAPEPDGFATVILVDNHPSYPFAALCLDSTLTNADIMDATGSAPDYFTAWDQWVPEGFGDPASPDYGRCYTNVTRTNLPAAAYDWVVLVINSLGSGGWAKYGHAYNFQADHTYLVTVHPDLTVTIVDLIPQVNSIVARPDWINQPGGVSRVTVNGITNSDMVLEVYLEGSVVDTHNLVGSYTSETVSVTFPANATGADQVYTVKVAGFTPFAEVTVAGEYIEPRNATVILTDEYVWSDGSGWQLWLDSSATAVGKTPLNPGNYDHFIPYDAPLSISNSVYNGSEEIVIPEGTYDLVLGNAYGSSYFFSSSIYYFNDVYFAAGHTYEFIATRNPVFGTYYRMLIDGQPIGGSFDLGIDAPVSLEIPQAIMPGTVMYGESPIAWTPDVAPLTWFHYARIYTATVDVTLSLPGLSTWVPSVSFTVGGKPATITGKVGDTYTVSYTFPRTQGLEPRGTGMATIILTVDNPWGDNTGFCLWLDENNAATGRTIADFGQYQHFIPVGSDTANLSVLRSTVSIEVPAGMYTYLLANRFTSGSFYSGDVTLVRDFEIESGLTYHFDVVHRSYNPIITITGEVLPPFVIELESVGDKNGSFTATFNEVPFEDPVIGDFIVEYSITPYGGTEGARMPLAVTAALTPDGYDFYDFVNNCYFEFEPFALPNASRTITVYVTWQGVTKSYEIFQGAGIEKITITSPSLMAVARGKTSQIVYTCSPDDGALVSVEFSSSNTNVATVSPTGLVTGIAVGNAVITITFTTLYGVQTLVVMVRVS